MKYTRLFLCLLLVSNFAFGQGKESAESDHTPWGGYWWSMEFGELVLGWPGSSRVEWDPEEVELFDSCLTSQDEYCTNLLKDLAYDNGKELSPLMKYDLYVKRLVEQTYGKEAPLHLYSHASKKELEIHYIGKNRDHPHYNSKGFAGKCIGWALSTFDYKEPTKTVELQGIKFEPADIKGILAGIYNGAQFFIPNDLVMGTEYRGGSKSSKAYKDVNPADFVKALRQTIGQGQLLEADLDPDVGVWNYPIFKYDMKWNKPINGYIAVRVKIHFANDEVEIEDVFSTQDKRKDFKTRSYSFKLQVPRNWDGNLSSTTTGHWTGKSIHNHPDALILGMEYDWKETILEYEDSEMDTEVNFELLKSHDGFESLVNNLVETYFNK